MVGGFDVYNRQMTFWGLSFVFFLNEATCPDFVM